MYKEIGSKTIIMTISGCLLSACVSVSQIGDVTADREGYLSKNFSPQLLSPAISKKLPSDQKTTKSEKLVITSEVTSEKVDGKKETWKLVETFVEAGNGLVQRMAEVSNNDIPYTLIYSLTYKGMFPIKWQRARLGATNTDMLYEVKGITRFDDIPSTVGKEFVVDYTSGPEPQIANFPNHQQACKSTRTMSASDINKNLAGQAIEFECLTSMSNAVKRRTKWAFFQAYGVAIETEEVTSANKITTRVIDVKG